MLNLLYSSRVKNRIFFRRNLQHLGGYFLFGLFVSQRFSSCFLLPNEFLWSISFFSPFTHTKNFPLFPSAQKIKVFFFFPAGRLYEGLPYIFLRVITVRDQTTVSRTWVMFTKKRQDMHSSCLANHVTPAIPVTETKNCLYVSRHTPLFEALVGFPCVGWDLGPRALEINSLLVFALLWWTCSLSRFGDAGSEHNTNNITFHGCALRSSSLV